MIKKINEVVFKLDLLFLIKIHLIFYTFLLISNSNNLLQN